jgi:hypothetical protein
VSFKISQKKLRVLMVNLLVFVMIASCMPVSPVFAADNNESVSITLGEVPVENGIYAWAGEHDSKLVIYEVNLNSHDISKYQHKTDNDSGHNNSIKDC